MNVCVYVCIHMHVRACVPVGPTILSRIVLMVTDQVALIGTREEKAGREWHK